MTLESWFTTNRTRCEADLFDLLRIASGSADGAYRTDVNRAAVWVPIARASLKFETAREGTDANPILSLMSLEAMRAFKAGLPVVVRDPQNREARSDVLYGAWLCSTALGYISMALHHKLAHVLGGSFNTPHAETHAILIPHTAAFNAVAAGRELAPVAEIFGSVGGGLWDFARECGAPMRLADLGLTEADLDRAAEIAVQNPYWNPRPFDRDAIRGLLQNAWEGRRPDD